MAASITILDVAIVLLCKLLYSREITTLEDITLYVFYLSDCELFHFELNLLSNHKMRLVVF